MGSVAPKPAICYNKKEENGMKRLHVVGAAIVEGGRVLAAKRGESRYEYVAHKYEFVGGKVETGESEEDALRREVFEELGAQVEVGEQLTEHESLAWIPLSELDAALWAPADVPMVEKLRSVGEKGASV